MEIWFWAVYSKDPGGSGFGLEKSGSHYFVSDLLKKLSVNRVSFIALIQKHMVGWGVNKLAHAQPQGIKTLPTKVCFLSKFLQLFVGSDSRNITKRHLVGVAGERPSGCRQSFSLADG